MDALDIVRIAASGFIGATVTPAIMALWSKYSPPSSISDTENYTFEQLAKKYSKINSAASVLSVLGLFAGGSLYWLGASKHNPWPVGLGFGLMVVTPVAFISVVTLTKGWSEFKDFWRFYEINYNIGIKGLIILYVLVSGLGFVSAYKLLSTGLT